MKVQPWTVDVPEDARHNIGLEHGSGKPATNHEIKTLIDALIQCWIDDYRDDEEPQ